VKQPDVIKAALDNEMVTQNMGLIVDSMVGVPAKWITLSMRTMGFTLCLIILFWTIWSYHQ
jgi:hypothetical protein